MVDDHPGFGEDASQVCLPSVNPEKANIENGQGWSGSVPKADMPRPIILETSDPPEADDEVEASEPVVLAELLDDPPPIRLEI